MDARIPTRLSSVVKILQDGNPEVLNRAPSGSVLGMLPNYLRVAYDSANQYFYFEAVGYHQGHEVHTLVRVPVMTLLAMQTQF